MTPTPSTPSASSPDEHPEVAEISALNEGILPVERQEELRSHLASCELCADVRASLDEIREVLGTLPGPAAMPEDVANRIDAALAAEALLDATAPDDTADAGNTHGAGDTRGAGATGNAEDAGGSAPAPGAAHDTEDTDTPEARGGSAATTMAAATTRGPGGEPDAVSRETACPAADPDDPADTDDAGHAADARPAGHVSRETRAADRPAGHPSGSTGPGRPASPARGGRRSRRWRKATLLAAASVAVLGIGGITLQSLSNSGDVRATSGSAADAPHEDGSAKSSRGPGGAEDRRMERRVQSLLSHQGSGAPSESGSRPGSGEPSDSPTVDTKRSPSGDTTLRENRTGGAATAPSCVREGIDRTENPLAVDADATYAGRSGYLVVLPHAGGNPRRVDAYVVDPSCVSADPSEPGKVLLKRTYPRG